MKTILLQYGKEQVKVNVPDSSDVLSLENAELLPDAAAAIRASLAEPIGSVGLSQLAQGCKNAAVVVSDNTRPVPYSGPDGILKPIIEVLKQNGVDDVRIIIACGTHRAMTEREIREMLGDSAFQKGVSIINHSAGDESMQRSIGSTERTSDVTINRYYLDAELKIATGLVEPHFMAGFSGGRKAICPGICGQSVAYGFHSASILNDERSTSLVLEGNPCHKESLEIAKMAGVDFIVNVTIDNRKQITGVFCGDLEKAHLAAVEHLCSYVSAKVDKLYDVIVTQAGDVGVNHYQCAKAAFEASRVVKPGGQIVLLAKLTDPEPIGGQNYKDMMVLLGRLGAEAFCKKLLSDDWSFVPEQWEAQMWAKVFVKLGDVKKLHLCAQRLASQSDEVIPETNVGVELKAVAGEDELAYAGRMVQYAVDEIIAKCPEAKLLVLPDGPYVVPVYCRS
ncbi:MAG: nickel-dependent lactate racemase family protein [Planctomycetota bacterium]|jgi:nickel-dependent lactate racemase